MQKSVWTARINNVCIPYSFTAINSSNHSLYGLYNGVQFTATLPDGNPNITDLIAAVCAAVKVAVGSPGSIP